MSICLFNLALTNSPCLWLPDRSLRQILKGPCKLLVRSMCAMAHSHARFIPLPVLIMSAFYLLCKARGREACNQAAFSALNCRMGLSGLNPQSPIHFYFSWLFNFLSFITVQFIINLFFCPIYFRLYPCSVAFSFSSLWFDPHSSTLTTTLTKLTNVISLTLDILVDLVN